ncbi:hypothetical protein CDAR_215291 [Caerostris darwini]|uniref:Methyltransferase domain-containing protein n=1 Tax=Caerostris darwini TaxID=1538125 RepID=A0AAV4U7B2_9ARAC|nr:hypothetical protein CDAR_215291 [Caerostris darwini]
MTKKLNPDFYYQWHEPFESVVHFFKAALLQVGWGEDNTKEVVMDVGCGPGETTTQLILPLFPSLKKVIAIDKLHDRIALACAQNFHPAIQFSVADIEEWSTIHQWKGQITKLVSVHCFHWVRNKKIGLEIFTVF